LCAPEEGLGRTTVTKRQGPLYRAARDVSWSSGGQTSPQDTSRAARYSGP
ncbi:hypothetical protein EF902_40095, partial [Streptomyces sp. WAC05858]